MSPTTTDYVILPLLPTPQAYHDLRQAAGLTPPPLSPIPTSLANSLACFLAFPRSSMLSPSTPHPSQSPVAMGRLVGDAALFLLLVDVAVHPAHQRRGLGSRIVEQLVAWVDEFAPAAYVCLVADEPGQRLYPRFGFRDVRPGVGMARRGRLALGGRGEGEAGGNGAVRDGVKEDREE